MNREDKEVIRITIAQDLNRIVDTLYPESETFSQEGLTPEEAKILLSNGFFIKETEFILRSF